MSKWRDHRDRIAKMAETMTDAQIGDILGLARQNVFAIRKMFGIANAGVRRLHAKAQEAPPPELETYKEGGLTIKKCPTRFADGLKATITARPTRG